MSNASFYVGMGICQRCCSNPVFSKSLCRDCLIVRRGRARKVAGSKPWKKGHRGRPPMETRPQPVIPAGVTA